MAGKAALLAPSALLVSVAALAQQQGEFANPAGLTPDAAEAADVAAQPGLKPAWIAFDAIYDAPQANQVRIEQRLTVRIAPRSPVPRQSLMAELPQQAAPQRLVERKMEDCIAVSNIAGVQTTQGNKLLLYLRDRRIVSARLERSCRARDFYSGFYIEQHDDGRLCVKRDKLQSRSGATCAVERLRRLVAADD